ncbi:unnamed protein product, partial [Brenthis ino]
MYSHRSRGPGFESRVLLSSVLSMSVKKFSGTARSWENGILLPPCLGEHVKMAVLCLNLVTPQQLSSSVAVVPPVYESDRNM